MPSAALVAKSESPIATTRVSGFGALVGVFVAAGCVGRRRRALRRDAIDTGPGLSPLSGFIATWPSERQSPFPPSCAALVSMIGLRRAILRRTSVGAIERASGKTVISSKPVVIGCGG